MSPRFKKYSFSVLIAGVLGAGGYVAYRLLQRRSETDRKDEQLSVFAPVSASTQRRFGGNTRDRVEEASWESFPASDPPSYY